MAYYGYSALDFAGLSGKDELRHAPRRRTQAARPQAGRVRRAGRRNVPKQSLYENDRRELRTEYLGRLPEAGVDVLYILTGRRGEQGQLGEAESDLLTAYLSLPADMRHALDELARALREKLARAPGRWWAPPGLGAHDRPQRRRREPRPSPLRRRGGHCFSLGSLEQHKPIWEDCGQTGYCGNSALV